MPKRLLELEVSGGAAQQKNRSEWCRAFAHTLSLAYINREKITKNVNEKDVIETQADIFHRRMEVERGNEGNLKISLKLEPEEMPKTQMETEDKMEHIMRFFQRMHAGQADLLIKNVNYR